MRISPYCIAAVLSWSLLSALAFPHAGLDLGGNRTRRDAPCKGDTEYLHGSICCLNCPAGTHVKSHCTRAGEKGVCEECDVYRTFTEHSNGLNQCFKCTQCRPDQETVRPCTQTQDALCQCKAGEGFCNPNQPCEVCKRCSRCGKDEEIVRNCAPTSNTECKKIQPKPPSVTTAWFWMFLPAGIILVVVVVGVGLGTPIKRCRESQRNPPEREKRNGQSRMASCSKLISSRQPVRATLEEREELCESLSSSASNSQHSLTNLPSCALPPSPPQAIPAVPKQPNTTKDDKPFPKLVPVKGEESLRQCFEYFEEMDVDYHKRFFRSLGLTDNVIKSKELVCYEDKIHELLNIWLEKEGRGANLNDLLKTLNLLDQRGTAESIELKAVENNHYVYEN